MQYKKMNNHIKIGKDIFSFFLAFGTPYTVTIAFPTTIQISFHKFSLTLFLQVLKFLSFNGINYKSHAKVLCTFKLNSQCHDSVPLMAL